jgi:hypothetical protein
MRLASILLALILLATYATAQEADKWRGLALDEATPADAKARLGEPSKPSLMLKQILKAARKRHPNVEALNWDDKEGFKDVTLYFVDGTLAWIYLERPKERLETATFVDAYPNLEFYVVTHGSALGLSPFQTNSFEAVTLKGKIMGMATGGTTYRELGLNGRGSKYKPEGNIYSIAFESKRWAKGNSKASDLLK